MFLNLSGPVWAAVTQDSTASSGSRRAITLGVSYDNNYLFFGRSQTTKYPYLSTELTYKGKSGMWVSAVGNNILNTATLIDETDLSAGWDFDFSKSIDGSIGYSHYFFAANSPLVNSTLLNSIDAYAGWDWGYVYSRLNASYLFGKSQDVFVVLDNSRYFEIDKVLTSKGYLSFVPKISVTAGSQSFAETNILTQKAKQSGKGGSHSGSGQVSTTQTTTSTHFTILNYQLRLPVTYSLGKVSVEGAWRYSVPVNLLPDDTSKAQSFWSVGLYLNL